MLSLDTRMPLQNQMSPKPLPGRENPVVTELGRPGAYRAPALLSTRCDRNAAHPGSGTDLPLLPDADGNAKCGQHAESGRLVRPLDWIVALIDGKARPGRPGTNVAITYAGQPRRAPNPAVAPPGAGLSRFCEHLLRPRQGEFYRIPAERELEKQRGPSS